jgi:hypothetical protein
MCGAEAQRTMEETIRTYKSETHTNVRNKPKMLNRRITYEVIIAECTR